MRTLLRHQIDRQTALEKLGGDETKFKTLVAQLKQTAQPLDLMRVNKPATVAAPGSQAPIEEESEEEITARIDSFFSAVKEMLWDDD